MKQCLHPEPHLGPVQDPSWSLSESPSGTSVALPGGRGGAVITQQHCSGRKERGAVSSPLYRRIMRDLDMMSPKSQGQSVIPG